VHVILYTILLLQIFCNNGSRFTLFQIHFLYFCSKFAKSKSYIFLLFFSAVLSIRHRPLSLDELFVYIKFFSALLSVIKKIRGLSSLCTICTVKYLLLSVMYISTLGALYLLHIHIYQSLLLTTCQHLVSSGLFATFGTIIITTRILLQFIVKLSYNTFTIIGV
jgi:hypothetical protein